MEVTIRGIPVHYEQFGQGQAAVFFSGWALDGRFMSYHYEPLFGDRPGWRRVYPDMPGMGRTPGAGWLNDQDGMLKVGLEFLDAVAPGERPAIVGASWGAYIALGVAHERPTGIDGLMLVVPVVRPQRSKRDLPPRELLVADPQLLSTLIAGDEPWVEFAVVQSRESLAAFRDTIAPALATADHEFLARIEQNCELSFAADDLPVPLEAPALILAGRQDWACGYRDSWPLLDRLPHATYAVLDRAGHDLEDVQRPLFEALTREWLDRVEEYVSRRSQLMTPR